MGRTPLEAREKYVIRANTIKITMGIETPLLENIPCARERSLDRAMQRLFGDPRKDPSNGLSKSG